MDMAMEPARESIESFRRALQQAWPGRTDIAGLSLDGDLSQAWTSASRRLAIGTAELAARLAPVLGVPLADGLDRADPAVQDKLSPQFCQRHKILPLRIEGGALVVATGDPLNASIRERAAFLANKPLRWVLAPPDQIDDALMVAFATAATRSTGDGHAPATLTIDDNAITRLTRALLLDAVAQRASDLHVQPFLGAAVVRIRVDGALRRLTMLTDPVAATLIRHVKAQSGMDPTNMQVPQDGRMSLVADGHDVDLRVSTLPASRGERLVIRFLDQARVHRLSGAGFSHAALQALRRAVSRPSGMVIITGPTGSGKTSTLYAMLAEINRINVNIITVENPVEYRVAGISQVEVNEKAGRSFDTALRSILRQDPDVVLIGEIRDRATAEVAAQAALTGHLVLSTLHANDAVAAIPRLLNLDVDPSILADSLAAVIAQRLCRVLCTQCRAPVTEPLSPSERLFSALTRNHPSHRPVGCRHCDFSGYRGRLPIVDILPMTGRLRDAVAQGERRLGVLQDLREGGLRSLAASGAQRVISGDTSVREVQEVVGPGFWPELAQHYGTTFTDDLDTWEPLSAGGGHAVLLITTDDTLRAGLADALAADGLRLVVAADAREAKACLQQDEDIVCIVGDLDEHSTLAQAVETAKDNRLHISWARLPAILLLPRALADRDAELRDSGVMADLLPKPCAPQTLAQHVRFARAR